MNHRHASAAPSRLTTLGRILAISLALVSNLATAGIFDSYVPATSEIRLPSSPLGESLGLALPILSEDDLLSLRDQYLKLTDLSLILPKGNSIAKDDGS